MKMMSQLLKKTGTIEVKAAPLVMLIGAVMASPNGPSLDGIIEMLDPDFDPN